MAKNKGFGLKNLKQEPKVKNVVNEKEVEKNEEVVEQEPKTENVKNEANRNVNNETEEKEKVEPKKEKPVIKPEEKMVNKNNLNHFRASINNAKSLEELFNIALTNEKVSHYVAVLKRYIEKIYKEVDADNGSAVIKLNYTIFGLFREALNEDNRTIANLKLDIIKKAICLGKDDYFNYTHLFAYDYLWNWATVDHDKFYKLLEIVFMICKGDRKDLGIIVKNEDAFKDFNPKERQVIINYLKMYI